MTSEEENEQKVCKNCGKKLKKPKRSFCSYECLYTYCKQNRKKYRENFLDKKRRENVSD